MDSVMITEFESLPQVTARMEKITVECEDPKLGRQGGHNRGNQGWNSIYSRSTA